VTLLCPSFSVGANSDVWDEALNTNTNLALPSNQSKSRGSGTNSNESSGAVEAGKIWAKGRNWTSVILEVVPASLRAPVSLDSEGHGEKGAGDEDEDLLEIPVFVRLEYETDVNAEDEAERKRNGDGEEGKGVERRELAYWMVLGVGRAAA
jgi:dynactin 4